MEKPRFAVNTKVSSRKGVFFNLGLFQFLTFLRRGVFYTFMINYLFILMQTVTSTAALGTLNMIASGLGQNLLWGRICDRYRLRTRLILIGETIAAFAYVVVYFVHRSLLDVGNGFAAGLAIIFGLSFLEFFWSMSDVGWAALLTDVTAPQTRGKVIGALNFIASLGRMGGIVFASMLYAGGEGFSNGTIFFIVPILLLVGVAVMSLTSRRIKHKDGPVAANKSFSLGAETQKSSDVHANERSYRWFLISLIVVVLGAASITQIFLLFIALPHGLNASDYERGWILGAWTVGGMVASLGSGALADRIGRRKTLFIALSIAIVTPLLYSFAVSIPMMALVYGVNGSSFWTVQTVGFAVAGDLIPERRRGRLLGRFNTVMALSWGPAGLLIGGPFADFQVGVLRVPVHAAYVNAFCLSSVLLVFGSALFAIKIRDPAKDSARKF
jgi:MFS family permease